MFTVVLGKPYVSLEKYLALSALSEVHEEICAALTQIPVDNAGGSHRSVGIVPPCCGTSRGSTTARSFAG